MKTASFLVCALLVTGCTGTPQKNHHSFTQPSRALNVIVFPGGFNWPIWAAETKGFFAREGLAVKTTPTPNSTFQMKGLIQGDFDIAMTAMDNVVAYREGQGEAGVDGPDLVAVMGSDRGFLRLVTAPQVRTYADLRGKTLSVDALTTGYAFVLLAMLEREGLQLGRDYRTERAGGVMQRYNALIEGKHAGTMLISPFDITAQSQGFNVLGTAGHALESYQGVVAAVRQSWARSNSDKVQGYVNAFADAVEWLYDPSNKNEAIRIFLANMPPNTTAHAAETAYRTLMSEQDGFQRHGRVDARGVETVVRLRGQFGRQGAVLQPAASYIDDSFYKALEKRP